MLSIQKQRCVNHDDSKLECFVLSFRHGKPCHRLAAARAPRGSETLSFALSVSKAATSPEVRGFTLAPLRYLPEGGFPLTCSAGALPE